MFTMNNKGYSLIELVISLFLISTLLLASAVALRALGSTTEMGIDDMMYRKNINLLASELKNGTSSIVSYQEGVHSAFVENGAGLVLQDGMLLDTSEDATCKEYLVTNLIMYTNGTVQKRIFEVVEFGIEDEHLNPFIQVSESTDLNTKASGLNVYGMLQMRDEVLDETAYKEGRIEWQEFFTYDPIRVTCKTQINATTNQGNEIKSTAFIVKTIKDEDSGREKLISIKLCLLLPTAKGGNRPFNMVFTCQQEVFVDVVFASET